MFNCHLSIGERRGGDSSPRPGFCPGNCLAGSPVRPLQHLSVVDRSCAAERRNPSIIGERTLIPKPEDSNIVDVSLTRLLASTRIGGLAHASADLHTHRRT